MADSASVSNYPCSASLRHALPLFLILGTAAVHAADETTPFYSFNHQPLAQIYGLPALGSARVLPPGVTDVQLAVNQANHFVSDSKGNEEITLDGETHRYTVLIRRGFGHGFEGGVELPYVSHSGGFLDEAIDNWHEYFNLPLGGRDQVPRDRLLYHYRRNGVDRLLITETQNGIGDVRLTGAKSLTTDDRSTPVTVRAQLKLPTGDSEALLGSGAADLALWVSLACPEPASAAGKPWCIYGGGGILFLGEGDVIPDIQNRQAGFASGGIAWRFLPAWSLKTQIDMHTPLYRDSELSPLGRPAAQWLLGFDYRHPGTRTFLEAGFAEDIPVDTAPDISFMLRFGTSYGS